MRRKRVWFVIGMVIGLVWLGWVMPVGAFGESSGAGESSGVAGSEREGESRGGDTLRVLVWNVLEGGNDVKRGPAKALGVIRLVQPDVVLLQESADIAGPRPALGRWLAEELDWEVLQGPGGDECVLTPMAIEARYRVPGRQAVGVRLSGRHELIAYSVHLDAGDYLPYRLQDQPGVSDARLLGSDRVDQTRGLLRHLEAQGQLEKDLPVLVGGGLELSLAPGLDQAHGGRVRSPSGLGVAGERGDGGWWFFGCVSACASGSGGDAGQHVDADVCRA